MHPAVITTRILWRLGFSWCPCRCPIRCSLSTSRHCFAEMLFAGGRYSVAVRSVRQQRIAAYCRSQRLGIFLLVLVTFLTLLFNEALIICWIHAHPPHLRMANNDKHLLLWKRVVTSRRAQGTFAVFEQVGKVSFGADIFQPGGRVSHIWRGREWIVLCAQLYYLWFVKSFIWGSLGYSGLLQWVAVQERLKTAGLGLRLTHGDLCGSLSFSRELQRKNYDGCARDQFLNNLLVIFVLLLYYFCRYCGFGNARFCLGNVQRISALLEGLSMW